MQYTIEFRNTSDNIIGTVENITNTSYCTSAYGTARSVIVWATYNGTRGLESEKRNITATPRPITSSSTTTTQEGMKILEANNASLYFLCYVIFMFLIYIYIYI